MKLKSTLLMAAFGLLSALSAQAANIKISSLPFTITAPGTYVLTGNLTFSSYTGPGINISSAAAGPIVLDLKGFTITGDGVSSTAILIGYISPSVSNTYPITIRNGTITNVMRGVGAFDAFSGAPLFDITVNNMVFNNISYQGGSGIQFGNVSSSTISNCTFNNVYYGIYDANSTGGNSFNNNSYVNNTFCLTVSSKLITLAHCQFSPPPSN
jgi:hypothetical protein